MLLGHRYYDSSTGRFLTRDPAKDGRNWSGYCADNPVLRADPTGHVGPFILAAAVIAVLILSTGPAVAPSEPNQKIDWQRFARIKAELALEVGTLPLLGISFRGAKLARGLAIAEEASAEIGEQAIKQVGRRGGPLHRKFVETLERGFSEPRFEHVAGGSKQEKLIGRRFADLWFKEGDRDIFIQVGKSTKDGRPIAREIDAAGDLAEFGDVFFFPYN